MEDGRNGDVRGFARPVSQAAGTGQAIHPAWRAFMAFCAELQHGEIDRLAIQNGLPVLAELTKKKVKFSK